MDCNVRNVSAFETQAARVWLALRNMELGGVVLSYPWVSSCNVETAPFVSSLLFE
jgi:hypothetical protein